MLNIDFALQKSITVKEGKVFVVRMEATNFLNTVQYGNPAATLGATNMGTIRGLASGPRNIQLVGRFTF